MKKTWIAFLIFLQGNTLMLDGFSFKVLLPLGHEKFRYSYFNEVEFVEHYIIFSDSSSITVQCGSNLVRPNKRENVIEKDTLLINDRTVFRNRGHEKGRRDLFWQEDVYKDLELSIMIHRATPTKLQEYRVMLDNVKVMK